MASSYFTLTGNTGCRLDSTDWSTVIADNVVLTAQIAPTTIASGANQGILAAYRSAGNQRVIRMYLVSTGAVRVDFTSDGTGTTYEVATSNVTLGAQGFSDGEAFWVRCTITEDNGAGGADLDFETSSNGTSWSALGVTQNTAPVRQIWSGATTSPMEIGTLGSNDSLFAGDIYYVSLGDSTTSPRWVMDADEGNGSSWTASTGETWTVQGDASYTSVAADADPKLVIRSPARNAIQAPIGSVFNA